MFAHLRVGPQMNQRNLRRFAVLGVILAAFDYFVDSVQKKLMYFPQPRDPQELRRAAASLLALGYELREVGYDVPSVFFGLGGNLKHTALLLVPKSNGKRLSNLWVTYGGNAMVSTDWLGLIEEMLRTAPARSGNMALPLFLLLDYPGYGQNQGSPCPGLALRSAMRGVQAALTNLRSNADGHTSEPVAIAFLGHSLGCAGVAQLAAALVTQKPKWLGQASPVSKVVLSAPFTSMPDMGRVLFGQLPGAHAILGLLSLISRHTWDNTRSIRSLARAAVPKSGFADFPAVSIVHGARDEIVPVEMGRSLHRLCRQVGLQNSEFIERPRAGHNDVLDEARSEYARLIFGSDVGKPPSPNL